MAARRASPWDAKGPRHSPVASRPVAVGALDVAAPSRSIAPTPGKTEGGESDRAAASAGRAKAAWPGRERLVESFKSCRSDCQASRTTS